MLAQCITWHPRCARLTPAWHVGNESRSLLAGRHGIAVFRPLVPGTRDEARNVHFRGLRLGKPGLAGKGREQDGTLHIAANWCWAHSACGGVDTGLGDWAGRSDGERDSPTAGTGTEESAREGPCRAGKETRCERCPRRICGCA